MTQADAVLWPGLNMLDRDGDKIGRIEDVFVDPETNQPEWALVNTGLFGMRSTFVPLEGATEDRQAVLVPYTKNQVQEAPNFERDHGLEAEDEAEIYRHFGLDSGATAGAARGQTPEEPAAPPAGGTPAGSPAPVEPTVPSKPSGSGDPRGAGQGSPPARTREPAGAAPSAGAPGPSGDPAATGRHEGGARESRGHEGHGGPDRLAHTAGRVLGGLRDRIEGALERYSAREEGDPAAGTSRPAGPERERSGESRPPSPAGGPEERPTAGDAGVEERPARGGRGEDSPLREGDEIGRRRGADGRMRRYVVTEVIDDEEERPV